MAAWKQATDPTPALAYGEEGDKRAARAAAAAERIQEAADLARAIELPGVIIEAHCSCHEPGARHGGAGHPRDPVTQPRPTMPSDTWTPGRRAAGGSLKRLRSPAMRMRGKSGTSNPTTPLPGAEDSAGRPERTTAALGDGGRLDLSPEGNSEAKARQAPRPDVGGSRAPVH